MLISLRGLNFAIPQLSILHTGLWWHVPASPQRGCGPGAEGRGPGPVPGTKSRHPREAGGPQGNLPAFLPPATADSLLQNRETEEKM